ncbi:MAG: hypothetical protein DRI79_12220 [Chloroflexi bacterium]|nr:MAG: hypothetical protein DRI79_12220 [Chloroflexota bacterium]
MDVRESLRCDAVVVGAGPAGSAAAYRLAQIGAEVWLVDRDHFPRDKPCGGGLTPRALGLLESMGLADYVLERGRIFTGVRIFTYDGGEHTVALSSRAGKRYRHGVVIPRYLLDDALRRRAVSAGARFLPGFTALAPHYRRGRLAGVQGHYNGRLLTVEAPLTIIATGAHRALMRTWGIFGEHRSTALAMMAYLTGLEGLDDHLEVYLDRELLPGYGWVFPVDERTANVGVGIKITGMTAGEGSRRLRTAFERLLGHDRLVGGRLIGRPRGSPLLVDFPLSPLHTDGALIVGEAAGLVNPLTGEGIALALESGQLAANAAGEALASGNLASERLSHYEELLRERYAEYFEEANELVDQLAYPEVADALLECSPDESGISRAFIGSAVAYEKPGDGLALKEILRDDEKYLMARSLLTIHTYRPLLDRCRAYMLAQVSQDAPSPHILRLLERGKMLRALLVFLGCQAAGGDPAQVLAAAAGVELAHAASLVHDDIMDNADARRGLLALHKALGTARAIVCGDYLFAKGFRLITETRTTCSAGRAVEATIVGTQTGVRACSGQFLDVGAWSEGMFTQETYERLSADKTASVIAGALVTGAVLAGGDEALLKTLTEYGECVGRAFQIRDDMLDFVNASTDGSSIDRRVSFPLVHAFQHSDGRGRDLILRFVNGHDVEYEEIINLLRAHNSLAYAEEVANSLREKAIRLAQAIPHIRSVLEAFAHYVVLRNR